MANDTAKTITTNLVPVQGIFEPLPPYECVTLVGPAGTPFSPPIDDIDGATINDSTIGLTVPAAAAFTTASSTSQPINDTDLCNKLYVDSAIIGISWKEPVRTASTANLTLSGTQTVDGVALVAGDRVLVKDQSTQANNGIYVVAAGAWSRAADADTWDELVSALLFVESGGQAGSAFYCPIQPGGTLGVTAITFNNFNISGTYFAGTGLTLTGSTFSITNTAVTPASYGSASAVPTLTVNAQGQLTAASNTNIAIGAAAITSGTIDSARLSGTYSGITGVGTLGSLTVSSTITGSISGNAATATSATSATTATTATNLAGGATGSISYQTGSGATSFLGIGSTGQVLTVAGGVPSWATPSAGTVTSVSGSGTVSGISLSGTVTSSGSLTLGGTLDLSSPPTIGNTTANTIAGTTVTASTSFGSPVFKATSSAGGTLQNASGAPQMQWGSGGGNNLSLEVATNINPANAAVSISPTGTGTVAISPAGALTINPTTASTMNNVAIGGTTAAAGTFTNLNVTGTVALAGSTGTAGYVLTSNGASAPTWQANANGITIADDTTTNATRYITFSDLTTGTETTLDVSSTKLQFNPSTGALTATTLTPTNALGTAYGGTGLTSLGSGVATWLGTPSSANLASAVTDETGTGALVFANTPTLVTPVLGTPTSGNLSNCTVDGTDAVGFRNTPINSQSTAYTAVLADSGKTILHPSADTTARTFTIPANSSVAYPLGTVLTFVNQNGAGVLTIAITSDTMRLAGAGTTGSRTLAANGVATCVKLTSTEWIISGNGLT